jgi:hypothetical protein
VPGAAYRVGGIHIDDLAHYEPVKENLSDRTIRKSRAMNFKILEALQTEIGSGCSRDAEVQRMHVGLSS